MRYNVFKNNDNQQGHFDFYDMNNKVWYRTTGKMPNNGYGITIRDFGDEFCGEIKEKLINYRPTFYMDIPKAGIIPIAIATTYYQKAIECQNMDIKIDGDYNLLEYSIKLDDKLLYRSTSKLVNNEKYLTIDIADEENELLAINIFVTLLIVAIENKKY